MSTPASLVRLTGEREIITDTLVVANEFGRNHRDVLRRIRQLADQGTLTERDFALSDYADPTGRKLPVYELTERGFLIAMPFIGGRKSQQGQVRLVDACQLSDLSTAERIETIQRTMREMNLPFAGQALIYLND